MMVTYINNKMKAWGKKNFSVSFFTFSLLFLLTIPMIGFAQSRTVTGEVKDATDGSALIGATIIETGTRNATVTDVNGRFTLNVSANIRTLTVSYIGYQDVIVNVGRKNTFTITMSPEAQSVDEIVVVGYGTQKKASVVGAISQISTDELERAGTPNLSNALAGRTSGIITVMGSGKPGDDDSKIYVRGQASPNGSDPLVLVDGVERDWKEIDTNDIESFNVLKDASATAVFGVRGANGVILITTKRGKKGRPQVKASVQTAFQQAIRLPEFLQSYEYALLYNEACANDNKPIVYSENDLQHYLTGDSPYTHPDNDYYHDMLKKTALQEKVNVSVSGGTDVVKYYVSGNFTTQEGLYRVLKNENYPTNNRYTRYSLRSNFDFDVTKTTHIGVDLTARVETRNQPNNNSAIFDRIQKLAPNWQPYINPDGSTNNNSRDLFNPTLMISKMGYRWNYKNVLEGSFTFNQKLDFITKGLSFKFLGSINGSFQSQRTISEEPDAWTYTKTGQYIADLPRVETSYTNSRGPANRNTSLQASLNYQRTIGHHTLGGLLLYLQERYWEGYDVPYTRLGWVGRATYAYRNRYLAEINMGYNGSTNFAKGKRYALFPAYSIGWLISEEKFWKIRAIDYFKIRGSYGEVGNDKMGSYQYFYDQIYYETPSGDGNQIYWGETAGNREKGIVEGKLANYDVTWERAQKVNVGLDLKMFDSTLTFSADLFMEHRKDILAIPYSVPLTLGMGLPSDSKRGLPPANIGVVDNKGFEIELGYNGKWNKLKYFVKGNFSYAKNKYKKIDEDNVVYEWQSKLGHPIGQNFGLTDIGLYQVDDFLLNSDGSLLLQEGYPILKDGLPVPSYGAVWPGDCRYADLNEDGVINNYDVSAIGKSKVPEYTYGFSLGGSYKGFDLNILFQGAGGADLMLSENAVWEFYTTKGGNGKVMKHHLGRYIPDDPSTWTTATYPRLHSGTNANNHQSTTRWLYSRNYLRLKNMELGYSLPKPVLQSLHLSACRFYVAGNNILTFSNILSWDPETSSATGSAYPQMRTWNVGINVTF